MVGSIPNGDGVVLSFLLLTDYALSLQKATKTVWCQGPVSCH